MRSKLCLHQGANSNENAAMAARKARFQKRRDCLKLPAASLGRISYSQGGRSLYYMPAMFSVENIAGI